MRFSKEEKAKQLETWKGSGKSACAYAKEKGINQQTFAKWVKTAKEPNGGFVEIGQGLKAAVTEKPEILIEKGDIKIHIPIGISGGEMNNVFQSLWASL